MIKIDEKQSDVIAFRAGEKKLAELQQSCAKKKQELSQATARYLESQKSLDDEAGELLEAGQLEFQPVTKTELERLQREVQVFKAAIEKQREIVDRLRNGYSRAICSANRAEYLAIEKRIAAAVRELAAANQAELEFFDALQAANVKPVGFRSTRANQIGTLRDPNSFANWHRKEIQQFVPEVAV
jgi:hypothetical protein